MKIEITESNVFYAMAMLDATAGSVNSYTTEELRHRMRLASAKLKGDNEAFEKELEIERHLQIKFNHMEEANA